MDPKHSLQAQYLKMISVNILTYGSFLLGSFILIYNFSETPWENKAVFMLYTELFIGFLKVNF